MLIKITGGHDPATGFYHWELYDGPDGIDEEFGCANSLGECFERILYHRTMISLSYRESYET